MIQAGSPVRQSGSAELKIHVPVVFFLFNLSNGAATVFGNVHQQICQDQSWCVALIALYIR